LFSKDDVVTSYVIILFQQFDIQVALIFKLLVNKHWLHNLVTLYVVFLASKLSFLEMNAEFLRFEDIHSINVVFFLGNDNDKCRNGPFNGFFQQILGTNSKTSIL